MRKGLLSGIRESQDCWVCMRGMFSPVFVFFHYALEGAGTPDLLGTNAAGSNIRLQHLFHAVG